MKVDPSKRYIIACKSVKGQNSELATKIAELLEYYSKNSKMSEPSKEDRSLLGRKIRNILRKYTTIGEYCSDGKRINYCFINFDIPSNEQKYLNTLYGDMQKVFKENAEVENEQEEVKGL